MATITQIDKRIAILTEKIEGRRHYVCLSSRGEYRNRGGALTQIRRAADKAIYKLTRKRNELYDLRWRILNTKPKEA